MNYFYYSGRVAQFGGLIVAVIFGVLFASTKVGLGPISRFTRTFLGSTGTPSDLLWFAGIGFGIFLISVVAFSVVGKRG